MARESGHSWKFFRAGGLDQVSIEKGDDIANLKDLDPKLWVALSCPARGLELDDKTLDLIDADGDGRIRVPEILEAAGWAARLVKDPGVLVKPGESLPLTAINEETQEGKAILESARYVLRTLEKEQTVEIGVADLAAMEEFLKKAPFNGDGMVSPDASEDPGVRRLIEDIITVSGGKPDRYGKPGVDQQAVDGFFSELKKWDEWQGRKDASKVFGETTSVAYEALQKVIGKIDDFFSRCRLAAFDERAAGPLNFAEEAYTGIAAKDLSSLGDDVAALPIAHVAAGRALPLEEGLNPAWEDPVQAFRTLCIVPVFGSEKTSVSAEEWEDVKKRFIPFSDWLGSWGGSPVEKLGEGRIREILSGDGRGKIIELIARDASLTPQINGLKDLDRLVRYHRDLYTLLNNFVSFTDFYSRDKWAVFQAGTLYLDARSCELCIRVEDPGKHAALAGLGKIYLAYCECTRKGSPQKMTIAAAFTGGDSDYLMVGRNGVFFDRDGLDWDATIVKILENPISIRQAVFAPYKRIARMIREQIEKMAASREKAVQDKAAAKIASTAQKVDEGKAPPKEPPPPVDVGKSVSIFAALAIAFGMIGSAAAGIVGILMGLKWWQWVLVPVALFIIISGPSVILAWLNLRQRTLGPVLDASGWAINGRVKINLILGGALTARAVLPPNSVRTLDDPYADKGAARRRIIALVVAAAIVAGIILWRYLR